MKKIVNLLFISVLAFACNSKKEVFDASGSFEADEVIVSSELSGQILTFNVNEGDSLAAGQAVGTIDADNLGLQKEQVEASIQSLSQKTVNVAPQLQLLRDQINVQQAQLANLLHERDRTQRLVNADAATGKQLDDITAQIDVVRKQIAVTQQQINVQKTASASQNRSILSEGKPLQKRAAQLEQQMSKSKIINPVTGTVLTRYAEQGEVTSPGKAMYKIADLSTLTLRAYVTGPQLSQIKLNQPVEVLIDNSPKDYKTYSGTITWISPKAEFTPKTIQTKEERANLVYAVKIKVRNDGYLKIGMFGEVRFKNSNDVSSIGK
ncbi:HlyD family secretion protein [Segetibacter aerophilus]|uniref:Membrane protein n=1 Tax=Segetibacter aerophilus TaxID=670293 RepID=A0A512BJQ8_9BACT|nr:HlyD family efflux transporter periplasmic adaptor subunit [Segetibacter aerophilus]GEO12211.1 membrane protein [Segetibacter aerophilus]